MKILKSKWKELGMNVPGKHFCKLMLDYFCIFEGLYWNMHKAKSKGHRLSRLLTLFRWSLQVEV